MKSKLFKSAVLIGLVAAGVSSAQAVPTFTMISGSNVNFFYDTDFWYGSTASVANNTLTFSNIQDLSASAIGPRRPTVLNVLTSVANPGVVAVAASGYKVSSDVVLGATGQYGLAATDGKVGIGLTTNVFEGTYNNAAQSFVHGSQIGGTFESVQYKTSTGTASSGSISATSNAPLTLKSSKVLGFDTNILASASQKRV